MEKVSNNQQSIPLWDRQNKERGHLSSVDKAIRAHRDQVANRQDRTDARLAIAQEINTRFFPQPTYTDRFSTGSEANKYDFRYYEEPTVSLDRPLDTDVPTNPMQSDDLYRQLAVNPVRSYAEDVVEKDGVEAAQEVQSDEVPKGSYIDYTV